MAQAAAPPAAESELRRIVQEMLDAVAPGNADVWRRYLHERVLRVDENGTVQNKEDLLKEFSPLPPGLIGRIAVDTFRAETHGDIAVVAYETQEHLDYHGQILRSRFRISDTWLKTGQGWQLLAEQVAAVLEGSALDQAHAAAALRIQRLVLVDCRYHRDAQVHAGRLHGGAITGIFVGERASIPGSVDEGGPTSLRAKASSVLRAGAGMAHPPRSTEVLSERTRGRRPEEPEEARDDAQDPKR